MSATTNARGNNANDDQRPLIDYEDGKVITCESEEDFYEIIRLASFSVTNDGTSTSATTTQSSEGQSHDRLIVFDCYADWCPPCRQMSPIFAGMAKDYPHIIFVKVNVDKHPEIGKLLGGIWAMPTFIFFRGDNKVGSFMGANERLLRRGLENSGNVSMCSTVSCQIQ